MDSLRVKLAQCHAESSAYNVVNDLLLCIPPSALPKNTRPPPPAPCRPPQEKHRRMLGLNDQRFQPVRGDCRVRVGHPNAISTFRGQLQSHGGKRDHRRAGSSRSRERATRKPSPAKVYGSCETRSAERVAFRQVKRQKTVGSGLTEGSLPTIRGSSRHDGGNTVDRQATIIPVPLTHSSLAPTANRGIPERSCGLLRRWDGDCGILPDEHLPVGPAAVPQLDIEEPSSALRLKPRITGEVIAELIVRDDPLSEHGRGVEDGLVGGVADGPPEPPRASPDHLLADLGDRCPAIRGRKAADASKTHRKSMSCWSMW